MNTKKYRGMLGRHGLATVLVMAVFVEGAVAAPACLEGVSSLVQAGKAGEALARLGTCPADSEDDAQVLLTKGRALTAAGRLADALAVFGRLAETQPNSASTLNNLAVVQAKLGRLPEARASLEKAVAIAPDFALAQENLADVYVRLARADYEKVAAKADAETRARATPGEAMPAAVPPAPTFAQNDREAMMAMATAWAADWSAGNWARYRGHYDAEFTPNNGRSLVAWETERRRRVAGKTDVRVTLSGIEVTEMEAEAEADSAEIRFVQSYASEALSEKCLKVLWLVRRPDGWRIVREIFAPIAR